MTNVLVRLISTQPLNACTHKSRHVSSYRDTYRTRRQTRHSLSSSTLGSSYSRRDCPANNMTAVHGQGSSSCTYPPTRRVQADYGERYGLQQQQRYPRTNKTSRRLWIRLIRDTDVECISTNNPFAAHCSLEHKSAAAVSQGASRVWTMDSDMLIIPACAPIGW